MSTQIREGGKTNFVRKKGYHAGKGDIMSGKLDWIESVLAGSDQDTFVLMAEEFLKKRLPKWLRTSLLVI